MKKHRMLYVFIGIAIAFPLVVLIVVLLCSADAVFASVIKKIFADINFFTVSKVVFLFVFALFSSYCGIKYLSKKRISDAPVETPAFPAAIGITVAATISVVLCYFSVLYRLCICFGGLMRFQAAILTPGTQREGFFQLLFVCILNVIIVLLGSGFVRMKIKYKYIFNFNNTVHIYHDCIKCISYGTVCVRVRADSHQALCVLGTWSDSAVYARSDFIYM